MTSKHPLRNTAIAASLVIFGIGCAHHHTPSAYGGGPPPVQASIDSAVERLAKAHCGRAERCGNVGPDREYATPEKCLTVMRGKATDDLSLDSCPGGIDEKNLTSCLSSVDDQKCGLSVDTFSRRTACRTAQLCYR